MTVYKIIAACITSSLCGPASLCDDGLGRGLGAAPGALVGHFHQYASAPSGGLSDFRYYRLYCLIALAHQRYHLLQYLSRAIFS